MPGTSRPSASEPWTELASGVFVRRHRSLRLNIGLVVGDDACLVVDTRSTEAEALDLIGAVRSITRRPWVVVNTHAHFDHCFGNTSFRPAAIWAHQGCADSLISAGETQRRDAAAWCRASGLVDLADGLEAVPIDPPDHLITDRAVLPLGGRTVELWHPGRGHTDHDVVVAVPDGGVLFAGDLVEEGDPPAFEDSYPLDWGETLTHLTTPGTKTVVPGHGAPVGCEFVAGQSDDLRAVADAARRTWAAGLDADEAWQWLPFPEPVARVALQRAWAQLNKTV